MVSQEESEQQAIRNGWHLVSIHWNYDNSRRLHWVDSTGRIVMLKENWEFVYKHLDIYESDGYYA